MSGGRHTARGRVVALCGGVGGAKLAAGLAHHLGDRLTVVVNTGDDFEHLGLTVCPDIDTVLYTLSGLANPKLGWGRADETWSFMETLRTFGGETWFQLGDRDLALHVQRTQALRDGVTLTAFIADAAARLGLPSTILPMSDDPVRTQVDTDEGRLPFQRYFVGRRCEPKLHAIEFEGAQAARMSLEVAAAFAAPDLTAIILCPSNPYLSIDPLLAVPGMRSSLERAGVPVVAVSPLIAGKAVKGPTAKIMGELGLEVTNATIADHYGSFLDGLVVDAGDGAEAAALGLPVHLTPTLMTSDEDRRRLAAETLDFAAALAAGSAVQGRLAR